MVQAIAVDSVQDSQQLIQMAGFLAFIRRLLVSQKRLFTDKEGYANLLCARGVFPMKIKNELYIHRQDNICALFPTCNVHHSAIDQQLPLTIGINRKNQ